MLMTGNFLLNISWLVINLHAFCMPHMRLFPHVCVWCAVGDVVPTSRPTCERQGVSAGQMWCSPTGGNASPPTTLRWARPVFRMHSASDDWRPLLAKRSNTAEYHASSICRNTVSSVIIFEQLSILHFNNLRTFARHRHIHWARKQRLQYSMHNCDTFWHSFINFTSAKTLLKIRQCTQNLQHRTVSLLPSVGWWNYYQLSGRVIMMVMVHVLS